MAGDVNESQANLVAIGRWQLEVGKSNVNRDAAALLLFETIGVDAGESLNQRGLAVVDMSGGADDYRLHLRQYRRGGDGLVPLA